MFLSLRPGISLDNLVASLRTVRDDATSLRGGGGGPAITGHGRLLAYLEWAANSVGMLHYQLAEADLTSLVLTRGFELLLSKAGLLTSDATAVQRVANSLVSLELEQRVEDLDRAIEEVQSYQTRWSNVGDLLLLDTNFYLVHPQELEDTDLAQLTAAVTPGWAMHVLVPLLVVEELDRQKRNQQTRSRARSTLKMLDAVFAHVDEKQTMSQLRAAAGTSRPDGSPGLGQITMELLLDSPGHERLPQPDAEIVDRAVAVQTRAGRPVTLVTYDTAMSLRARAAGLREVKLPYPVLAA